MVKAVKVKDKKLNKVGLTLFITPLVIICNIGDIPKITDIR